MANSNQQNSESSGAVPWMEIVSTQWQRDLAMDKSEIDMDLLAAYAEGRLSAQEQVAAEALIADSPVALECFVAMKEAVIEERDRTPLASKDVGRSAKDPATTPGRPSLSTYATAASLLIGCLAIGWAASERSERKKLQSDFASLSHSFETQLTENLVGQKEQGVILAAKRTSPFFAGRVSPRMIGTIGMSFTKPKGADSPLDREFVDEISQQWRTATTEWGKQNENALQQSVETAFRLIVECQLTYDVGDDTRESNEHAFASARQAVDTLKRGYPDHPEVRNVEAVLLLQQAEFLLEADAADFTQQAKSILDETISDNPGYPTAWLNRGLLAYSEGELNLAKRMWKEYADRTEDRDVGDAVLGLLD